MSVAPSPKVKKGYGFFVEEVLEEAVGTELAFPKLPPEFFEKATELDGQFVLRNSHLPAEYDGLDDSGQATVDKNVLADARYEKDLTRG